MSELTKSQKRAAKPRRKRMSWKKRIMLTIMVIIPLLAWWGYQPVFLVGSPLFGLCRTYIELNVPYPNQLEFVDLRDNFDGKVDVDYIYNDGFGEHLYTQATCVFDATEAGDPYMKTFRFRRGRSDRPYLFNAEKQDALDRFNKSVPAILASQPELRIRAIPQEIKEYKN